MFFVLHKKLLKDCVYKTCLQNKFPDFEKHLVENLIFLN